MTDRWLVEIGGLRLGPLERADVQQMLDSGELRLDDRVCPEDSNTWQLAQDLYDDEDGDQLLGDSDSHVPLNRVRRPVSVGTRSDHQWTGVSRSPDVESQPESASCVATEVTTEPMFYVQRGGDEVGPLPHSVVQEFAHDGLLNADTPVRGEDDAAWSTADEFGFEFPIADVEAPASAAPKVVANRQDRLRGSALWIVFAPFYFVLSAAQSLASLSRRQMLVAAVVLLAVGAVGMHLGRTWSQTAFVGRITLDGEPLANVVILLTGTATGDSGTGVSDDGGRFRVVTLDGNLQPGEYTVTVHPLTAGPESDTSKIPERYTIIGLSDAVVDVTESTSTCDIELTSQRRLKRGGGYFGGSSAGASVLE